jgi:lysozyme family protein
LSWCSSKYPEHLLHLCCFLCTEEVLVAGNTNVLQLTAEQIAQALDTYATWYPEHSGFVAKHRRVLVRLIMQHREPSSNTEPEVFADLHQLKAHRADQHDEQVKRDNAPASGAVGVRTTTGGVAGVTTAASGAVAVAPTSNCIAAIAQVVVDMVFLLIALAGIAGATPTAHAANNLAKG